MFSIAIVIFREVLEIALILGVLMAATKGLPKRSPWVWMGMVMGLAGAVLIAIFADAISQAAQGMGQEMMNAIILFIAAFLIGWTVLWMTRHGRELTKHFKDVGHAVTSRQKPMYTLAVVVALSVLREGAEIVMFIYSAVVTGGKAYYLVMGGLLGSCAGIMVGMAIYYGLMKVPTRQIFAVTSWLLIFLIGGMVAQAFGYLVAAGRVPELVPAVWDSSGFIAEGSIFGKIMHTLVGYVERPSGIQLLVYVLTITGMAMALKLYAQNTGQHAKKAAIVLIGTACLFGLPQEAQATKKVYSPLVEQGELEFEARGQYDFDHKHPEKNDLQKQKYAIGYGVNEWWFTELYGEIEKGRNSDDEDLNFKFTSLEFENRFRFTPQGKYWLDVGGYLAYEGSFEDKHPDEVEWKLLLEKSLPNFTHTANIIFSKEVGGGNAAEEVEGGFAWSSKYRLSEKVQPGFEYHAKFGTLRSHNNYNMQTHQVGPTFYGKLSPQIKYDVGYLFGISKPAPLGELKWILEYEMRF